MTNGKLIGCAICVLLLAAGNSALAAPPPNDDFANATPVLEPLPFVDAVSTAEATTETDDPSCASFPGDEGMNAYTVWYSYTPSADGWVKVVADGDFDPTVGVYTGADHASLEQVACVDAGIAPETANFFGEAGTTYYVMVASFFGTPGGNLTLTVDEGTPPPDVVVNSAAVNPKTGTVLLEASIEADSEVFFIVTLLELVQPSGRGVVFDSDFKFIFQPGTSTDITTLFVPEFGAKGFVGGKATLRGFFVVDEGEGDRQVEINQEIKLKPAK